MTNDSLNDKNTSSMLVFENGSEQLGSDAKTKFNMNIDRSINVQDNTTVATLLRDNRIDFYDPKIQVKTLNLQDMNLLNNTENQLLEVDLGEIHSSSNLKLKEAQEILDKQLDNTSDYTYKVSLIGKHIEDTSDDRFTKHLIKMENEGRSDFISPTIFHDEEEGKKESIVEEQSPFRLLLENPILLILFFSIGYYVYPNLWKKDYFMNLSHDFNNSKILSQNTYDYVNYRRGLYVSVRSNFS